MAVGGNRCGCSAYALQLVDGQQDRGYNAIHRTRTLLAMKAGRQLAAELYPDTHQLQCISLDYAIMLEQHNIHSDRLVSSAVYQCHGGMIVWPLGSSLKLPLIYSTAPNPSRGILRIERED